MEDILVKEQDMAESHSNIIHETHFRSIIKGLLYRILGSLCTVLVAYTLLREPIISLEIGGLEFLAKVFLYYAYERTWNFISWGRLAKDSNVETMP